MTRFTKLACNILADWPAAQKRAVAQKIPGKEQFLSTPLGGTSGTDIRATASGTKPKEFAPPAVAQPQKGEVSMQAAQVTPSAGANKLLASSKPQIT